MKPSCHQNISLPLETWMNVELGKKLWLNREVRILAREGILGRPASAPRRFEMRRRQQLGLSIPESWLSSFK